MENDADFVNNVMASQTVKAFAGTKNADTVSAAGSSKTESASGSADGTISRKRMLSNDDAESESDRNKKLKQQEQKEMSADVSSDFAIMMKWMKQEFDGVKSDLTKTIDNRVDSLEEKLRTVMLAVVKEEVDKARQEFNTRIDGLASKVEHKIRQSVESKIEAGLKQAKDELKSTADVETLKQEINSVKKSYAEITKSEVGIQDDIVIRNYPTDAKETDDPQVTLNKVNSLIRDGLKIKDINVVKCERKPSRGNSPGVILASLETGEQKLKVLETKKKLRNTKQFAKVYIDEARPLASRINEANMMTVLQEMGKRDKYFLSSKGRIVRRAVTGNQQNQQNGAEAQR